MSPTGIAVERYNELLTRSDVAGLWQEFQVQMQENMLFFGERPVCNVLRPHFLHPQEFDYIARAAETVLGAIHRLYQALSLKPLELQRLLHLSEVEQALTELPDYYGRPDASARIDAFWLPSEGLDAPGQLYFLEYNSDSPGGLAFGDVLTELFLAQRPMQEFAQEYRIQSVPVRQQVYATLLDCYRDWARAVGKGQAAVPNIAIVDWREVRTRNEFVLLARVFERGGSRVVICDPDELEYQDGRLRVGADFPVDIVYKRVVVNEFIEKFSGEGDGLEHPLVQAAKDQAVCVVNGFNVQLLYNKALFALLGDEAYAGLLTAEELAAVRRHVPWSRLVQERRTALAGREVDLVELILTHKDDLVLKPIRQYGGSGVVLGWETGQQEWEAALRVALEQPHIVQRRVPTPRAYFPIYQDGLHFVSRTVDVDPYVWRGTRISHAGVRLGTGDLLNVSAGGSATPLFLVEKY